jgi:hypothetical protein
MESLFSLTANRVTDKWHGDAACEGHGPRLWSAAQTLINFALNHGVGLKPYSYIAIPPTGRS